MATTARQVARVTTARPVKKLQKPRPLKAQTMAKHATIDTSMGVFEEIMTLADNVANSLANGNIDRSLQFNIISLNNMLKSYGENLEVIYKDQLDRAFVIYRNGCRDEKVDYISRLHLLELIELRAMQWNVADNSYYKHKFNHQDIDLSVASMESSISSSNSAFLHNQMSNTLTPVITQPLMLGPDELVKSSGKFSAPTKIPGKNYCKDEVVIRNSDSGKVNPGAKERLVQITGPSEGKIIYAKQLMEDTIRRNASPVRTDLLDKERLGSSSSLNSSTSDDSLRYRSVGSKRSTLLHSFSTNDANLGEYKYTVTVGDSNLKVTGTNLDLVRAAKLVLDEYFSLNIPECTSEYDIEEGAILFEPAVNSDTTVPLTSQDSEESEDTYRVQQNAAAFGIMKSSSLKKIGSASSIKVPAFQNTEKFQNVRPEINAAALNQPKKITVTESTMSFSNARKGATVNLKTFSPEVIFHYADSPLSRQVPYDWVAVPTIMKKLPITDWVDSKSMSKRRPREDTASIIVSISEPITPE
ncbi:UNVERIFIED_CONTAM: hypothetical protein PYX00_006173 [Menopon gallinae]|uniref:Eukaryotic translation initiation factor 4E-binding protein Mextli n=1 Tax=Menopon gallinae TaxID=328185 RepID=A0AAW2HUT1_9NEOP